MRSAYCPEAATKWIVAFASSPNTTALRSAPVTSRTFSATCSSRSSRVVRASPSVLIRNSFPPLDEFDPFTVRAADHRRAAPEVRRLLTHLRLRHEEPRDGFEVIVLECHDREPPPQVVARRLLAPQLLRML